MSKGRKTPERGSAFGIAGQWLHLVSDVRLEIPCWLLDIDRVVCTTR